MAVITNDSKLEILNLNEEIYMFDKKYSFIKLEFLTLTYVDIETINIDVFAEKIIDISSDEYNKNIKTNPYYEKYILNNIDKESVSTKRINNKYYDFNKTFSYSGKINFRTNYAYEGENNYVKIINSGEKKINIYNIEAIVHPISSIVEKHNNEIISLEIKTKEKMDKNTVYAFRIGFWLKNKTSREYDLKIYGFSCEKKECTNCEQKINRCNFSNSRLWIKINNEDGLSRLKELLIRKQGDITEKDLSDLNLYNNHSDIWIIIPKYQKLLENNSDFILREFRDVHYILFDQERQDLSELNSYDLKYNDIYGNKNFYYLTAKEHNRKLNIKLKGKFEATRILLNHFLRYLNIPILLILLNINEFLFKKEEIFKKAFLIYVLILILDMTTFHKNLINYMYSYVINIEFIRKKVYKLKKQKKLLSNIWKITILLATVYFIYKNIQSLLISQSKLLEIATIIITIPTLISILNLKTTNIKNHIFEKEEY